jgi:hypothetical protein
MTDVSTAPSTGRVTVSPTEFVFVKFDADEIAEIVTDLAAMFEIPNPIHVVIDESTPLAKLSEDVDGTGPTAAITLHAESGALEDRQHPMSFSAENARESFGRILLRAHDRLRPDFADVPADLDLTLEENAAWDTYCVGRLARLGIRTNQQRWRYNHRNRFGFDDGVDAAFDALWAAEDLGWSDVLATARG